MALDQVPKKALVRAPRSVVHRSHGPDRHLGIEEEGVPGCLFVTTASLRS